MRNLSLLGQVSEAGPIEGVIYDLALRLYVDGTYGGASWFHGTRDVSTFPAARFQKAEFAGIIGMDLLQLGSLYVDGRHCTLGWGPT